MLSIVLIVLIVLLYSFQTLFCRLYNDRYPGRKDTAPFVYNVFYGVFVTLVTLALNGFSFRPSLPTVLYGLLNSLALFLYNYTLIKATESGSYAIANLSLLAGGILIPLAQSVIVFKQPLNTLQYLGVGIMLAAFGFLNADGLLPGKKSAGQMKKRSLFPLFCAFLFLANGAYGAFFNAQQEAMKPAGHAPAASEIASAAASDVRTAPEASEAPAYDTERSEMIVLTFLPTAALGFALVAAKNKRETLRQFMLPRRAALYLLICCASAAIAVNLLVYVMRFVSVPVLYTVDNGGVLVMSVLYATFLFKEKLTPNKCAGLALALISLILLGAATSVH